VVRCNVHKKKALFHLFTALNLNKIMHGKPYIKGEQILSLTVFLEVEKQQKMRERQLVTRWPVHERVSTGAQERECPSKALWLQRFADWLPESIAWGNPKFVKSAVQRQPAN